MGLYYVLVHKMTLGKLFLAIWVVLGTYFSCVMVRLMLVLAPAVCIIASIAIGELFNLSMKAIRYSLTNSKEDDLPKPVLVTTPMETKPKSTSKKGVAKENTPKYNEKVPKQNETPEK